MNDFIVLRIDSPTVTFCFIILTQKFLSVLKIVGREWQQQMDMKIEMGWKLSGAINEGTPFLYVLQN